MTARTGVLAIGAVVAVNLRAARAARGVSQERLAINAGLSRASVCHIEEGASNPLLDTLASIAAALDMPAHYLLLRWEDLRLMASACSGAASILAPDQAVEMAMSVGLGRLRKAARIAAAAATHAGGDPVGAAIGACLPLAAGANLGSSPPR